MYTQKWPHWYFTRTQTQWLCRPTCHCNVKIECCQLCPRKKQKESLLNICNFILLTNMTRSRYESFLDRSAASHCFLQLLQFFFSCNGEGWPISLWKQQQSPRQLSKSYPLRSELNALKTGSKRTFDVRLLKLMFPRMKFNKSWFLTNNLQTIMEKNIFLIFFVHNL